MAREMTVGKRIGIVFTVVILIAIALGGLGVWSMLSAKNDSTMLATEYVPEVKVATELNEAVNHLMYEMRGYGFSEDSKFYDSSVTAMDEVKTELTSAADLADKAVLLKALKG